MTRINQLSIFLQNKEGSLLQVLNILKEAKVQIITSTIADTADYGILRLICNRPQEAYQMLKEKGVAVTLSRVIVITLDNKVGEAAAVMAIFAEAGINISYLYSFLINGRGILIFRTNNPHEAEEVIEHNNLSVLSEEELESWC